MSTMINMEFMKTIGNRILERRSEERLSQRALGKITSTTASAISLWEKDVNIPNGENLLRLARALKTTPDWILTGTGGSPLSSDSPNTDTLAPEIARTKTCPVFESSKVWNWFISPNDVALKEIKEWEEAPLTSSNNAFWLKVVGDSMVSPTHPTIPEGHLILVEPSEPITNGSLVVAKLENTEEVTFKKLVIDSGMKFLRPLNPTYPTFPIDDSCQILGAVKQAKVYF